MTGPEHYHEAERLMRWWAETTPPQRKRIHRNVRRHGATPLPECVAAAQVHATLALAAATAASFIECRDCHLIGALGDGSLVSILRTDDGVTEYVCGDRLACRKRQEAASAPACATCGTTGGELVTATEIPLGRVVHYCTDLPACHDRRAAATATGGGAL